MTFNLLYCLDSNYNLQAQSSIVSILDLTDSKLNIYVIHKDRENFTNSLSPYIKNHEKLNSINIFNFDFQNIDFKNLENSHVTEATYYRLFFDRIIPKEIENLIYLDSDVICINKPDVFFKNIINQLSSSNFIIGVKTTSNRKNEPLRFEDLGLKSNSYFNAGVMFINTKKWRKDKIFEQIRIIFNKKNLNLKFWDQDILNKIFDGEYLEIDQNLNLEIRLGLNKAYSNDYFDNIVLVHYSGKSKPWNNKGLFNKRNEFYHNNFRKINTDYYHIEHVWLKLSIKYLLNSFTNRKFFKIEKKLKFLKIYFKKIFQKIYARKLI